MRHGFMLVAALCGGMGASPLAREEDVKPPDPDFQGDAGRVYRAAAPPSEAEIKARQNKARSGAADERIRKAKIKRARRAARDTK